MKTHIVISKLHYENEPDLLTRIECYKQETLPSLLAQTNQNFDIGILCNPKHKDIIQAIDPRIIPYFTDKFGVFIERDRRKFYTHFCEWKDIYGLNEYDIQTSIDSDDSVSPDFIQKIVDTIEANEEEITHVHFQPILRKLDTKDVSKMRIRYCKEFSSGFFSLYQRNKDNYIYIGQFGHGRFGKLAKRSILIPEGYCFLNVHDGNASSGWDLAQ